MRYYSREIQPEDLSLGSNKQIWWKCIDCEHEWSTAVCNRSNGTGCPYCKGNAVHSDGRNSLSVMFPKIAAEFVGDAKKISALSSRRVEFACATCGHTWKTQLWNRTGHGRGCPACCNQQVHNDGRNSLAVVHPELANELIGDPSSVLATTNKKLRWRCATCSHEWSASGSKRVREGQNCNACANKVLHVDGKNSLEFLFPDLAKELIGNPSKVIATTSKKAEWRCSTCQSNWKAAVNSRTVFGTGCPVCNNKVIHQDLRNAMSRTHPELARELVGNPDEIVTGTNLKLDWKCSKCDHEWSAVGAARGSGLGCPACSNHSVHMDGRNSLAVAQPQLAQEFLGDPTKVVATSSRRLRWKCSDCELEWTTTAYDRVNGRGCPGCAKYGFQANEIGWYYALRLFNQDGDTVYFKGGITSDIQRRIQQIKRNLPQTLDVELIESVRFELGQDARNLETELLGIEEIRAPKREFDGGNELFIENPIEYARIIGILD
jgi:Zn finger protein HypA/HybF involved in hydrogenase expression